MPLCCSMRAHCKQRLHVVNAQEANPSDRSFCVQSKAEARALKAQRKAQRQGGATTAAPASSSPPAPAPAAPTPAALPAPASNARAGGAQSRKADDLPEGFFENAAKRQRTDGDAAPRVTPTTPAAAAATAPSAGAAAPAREDKAGALPRGFFDDAAADARVHGDKARTEQDKEAALAALQREVDEVERREAEAEAAAAEESAARQLALDRHELRCAQGPCVQRVNGVRRVCGLPCACGVLAGDGAQCVCRQQLEEVRRLRQGERVGVAAALPEAVSTRRRVLAERRALLAAGSGDEGDGSTGEDDDALLAVDWRARR